MVLEKQIQMVSRIPSLHHRCLNVHNDRGFFGINQELLTFLYYGRLAPSLGKHHLNGIASIDLIAFSEHRPVN